MSATPPAHGVLRGRSDQITPDRTLSNISLGLAGVAARLARAYQDWLDDTKRDASEPPPVVARKKR